MPKIQYVILKFSHENLIIKCLLTIKVNLYYIKKIPGITLIAM